MYNAKTYIIIVPHDNKKNCAVYNIMVIIDRTNGD